MQLQQAWRYKLIHRKQRSGDAGLLLGMLVSGRTVSATSQCHLFFIRQGSPQYTGRWPGWRYRRERLQASQINLRV